jgi:ATP-dependent Lon protease, bacterial type
MNNLKVLPLMPLRELVVFPQTAVPLFIGRAKSIVAIDKAYQKDKLIFLATQKDPKIDSPTPEDIYRVGTISRILQLVRLPDNTLKVLVEGLARGRIIRYLTTEEYFSVEVEEMNEVLEEDVETIAL